MQAQRTEVWWIINKLAFFFLFLSSNMSSFLSRVITDLCNQPVAAAGWDTTCVFRSALIDTTDLLLEWNNCVLKRDSRLLVLLEYSIFRVPVSCNLILRLNV